MLGELVQVGLLLLELLLQLQELLLLALADGVVLGSLLAAGEGVTSMLAFSVSVPDLSPGSAYEVPVPRGAPVSPSAMRMALVAKVRAVMVRRVAGRAAAVNWRSILLCAKGGMGVVVYVGDVREGRKGRGKKSAERGRKVRRGQAVK